MKKASVSSLVIALAISFAAGQVLRAQLSGAPNAGYKTEPGMPASAMPKALQEIGFDQRIDEHLPLDALFKDEFGKTVRLGDYFGQKPVVLSFAYFECPMLCTMSLNGLTSALKVLSLEPGRDFEVLTISFDPKDTPQSATEKKAHYVERYANPGADKGWHFLTGDQAAIEQVTGAAGFRYTWDEDTKQFAHPTGVIVVTPDGRLARYLFGIEYGPRDLRYALVEASDGRVGNVADQLLLYCFHYDPETGRYGLVIMRAIRIAGAATVLALGGFIFVMARRERKR